MTTTHQRRTNGAPANENELRHEKCEEDRILKRGIFDSGAVQAPVPQPPGARRTANEVQTSPQEGRELVAPDPDQASSGADKVEEQADYQPKVAPIRSSNHTLGGLWNLSIDVVVGEGAVGRPVLGLPARITQLRLQPLELRLSPVQVRLTLGQIFLGELSRIIRFR